MSTKTYTVSEASRLAHVTVRTLHHYDEIGLLVPSQRASNGYRRYTDADLQRLHQILVFKELGFALDAIQALLDEPAADRRAALLAQRQALQEQQHKTAAVIRAIETAIQTLEGETTMDTNDMFEGFDEFEHAEYAEEARERWGQTEAYQESMRRTKLYTKDDWTRMKAEGDAITQGVAELMRAGHRADERAVTALAEQHRLHIDRWFYPCSHEIHVALGEMYVADPRFTATYDQVSRGLAQYLRDAIVANATTREK
jgi:DNA-binding transcriptional MerR regulator